MGAYAAVNGVTSRAARRRVSVDSLPSSSMDSNSGGETCSPEMPTRRAPKALRGLSSSFWIRASSVSYTHLTLPTKA